MRRLVCAVLLTVAACSGGPAQHPTTPIAEAGSARPPEPRGSDAPAPAGPTTAECDALVAHVVQLARGEQPTATADDAAQTKSNLEPFTAECATLTLEQVHCATSASTLPDVAGCQTRGTL